MRVLFRTELFYHSTAIFSIVPSVTLDRPQLHGESKKDTRIFLMSLISLSCYQISHPATPSLPVPSSEL